MKRESFSKGGWMHPRNFKRILNNSEAYHSKIKWHIRLLLFFKKKQNAHDAGLVGKDKSHTICYKSLFGKNYIMTMCYQNRRYPGRDLYIYSACGE